MTELNMLNTWNPEQQAFIRYLAAGRKDKLGNSYEKQEFAKLIGVHPTTLSRWQQLPGFKQAVFDQSMGYLSEYIPAMNSAMVKKVLSKQDTQAYLAVMRQYELLKNDKQAVEQSGEVGLTVTTLDFKSV